MKVRLKKASTSYRDLTPGNVYRVIGIEADDYRIMNDAGQPFLYPPRLFQIVDASEPRAWKNSCGDDGERYAYPPELARRGFFEDYFDDDPKALATLRAWLSSDRPKRRKVS
jgi:hypothetical protein